ncbi:hypothetical protein ACFVYP_25955 [Kitasatospora sp. NPDC058201]|uniref:hypothetical protein n=1 Tax=unclassified Kitasatospora TaxID=2633591 RepID=UPI0036596CEA
MSELIFRGRDRYRPARSHLLLAIVVFVFEGTFASVTLGPVWAFWLIGGTIAVLAPVAYCAFRSWSRVGPAGVTICWGIGRGRTYAWQEVQWIDTRETDSRYGSSTVARMFLVGGRRRSLPGLQHSDMYPDPEFGADYRRVVDWWELSTDQGARVRPPRSLRDRISPVMLGFILAVVFAVVAAAVMILVG